jgi:hypothetical protein
MLAEIYMLRLEAAARVPRFRENEPPNLFGVI